MRVFELITETENLFEFNVINIDAIEKFIEEQLPTIAYEPCRKWFFSAVRKFLINDERSNSRITTISSNAPEWLKKKHEQNKEENKPDDFYYFHLDNNIKQRLGHVIDWLNSLYETSNTPIINTDPNFQAKQNLVKLAQKYLNSLSSLDIKNLISDKQEKVKHHVEDWFEAKNLLVSNINTGEGEEEIKTYNNGVRWVKLVSQQALDIEGKKLGHCVGGYWDKVKSGSTIIYSLRDNKNNPHVTVEVSNDKLVQVKGKQNQAPVAKYVPYVKDFLNTIKVEPNSYASSDVNRMGLRFHDGKYGSLYDISEVVYKDPSGIEIIKVPKEDEYYHRNTDTYHLWENETDYGYFSLETRTPSYSTFNLSLNRSNDDPDKNKSIQNALKKIVINFVNSLELPQEIRTSSYYDGYYTVGNKIKLLTEFPLVDGDFTSNIYKISNNRYVFADKETNDFKFDFNTSGMSFNGHNKLTPNDRRDLILLLNAENIPCPKNNYSNLSTQILIDKLIVYKDGKWFRFRDGANVVKSWDGGTIYKFENTYKVFLDSKNGYILTWKNKDLNDSTFTTSISNCSKQLVDFFNEIGAVIDNGRGKRGGEFKKLGLIYSKGKWTSAKDSAIDSDESGYTISKISTTKGIISDNEGNTVGHLEFEGKNGIVGAILKTQESADFLYNYGKKNPKTTFSIMYTEGSPNFPLFNFGYTCVGEKLEKIEEIYPTIKVAEGKMTWYRQAYINKDFDKPSEYRYVLKDGNNKIKMVVNCDGTHINEIIPLEGDMAKAPFEEVNVVPYLDDLNALFSTLGLSANGHYLAKSGLIVKDGKIEVVDTNNKLKQFIDGRITYENGYAWIRSTYSPEKWQLTSPTNSTILSCDITQDGITKIDFTTYRYKENRKMFREYLNDMMDIVDDM